MEAAVPWGKEEIANLIPTHDCDRIESSPPLLQYGIQGALEVIVSLGVSEAPSDDPVVAPNKLQSTPLCFPLEK